MGDFREELRDWQEGRANSQWNISDCLDDGVDAVNALKAARKYLDGDTECRT